MHCIMLGRFLPALRPFVYAYLQDYDAHASNILSTGPILAAAIDTKTARLPAGSSAAGALPPHTDTPMRQQPAAQPQLAAAAATAQGPSASTVVGNGCDMVPQESLVGGWRFQEQPGSTCLKQQRNSSMPLQLLSANAAAAKLAQKNGRVSGGAGGAVGGHTSQSSIDKENTGWQSLMLAGQAHTGGAGTTQPADFKPVKLGGLPGRRGLMTTAAQGQGASASSHQQYR